MGLKNLLNKTAAKVINPVVECVDVDGVLRRIHINDLLERIDVNELVDRVDINRVLERIDINHHAERVDINRVLERVNINEIILRSDVGAILTHSTTGIVTDLLDAIRSRVIVLDMWLMSAARFSRMRPIQKVPPSPYRLAATITQERSLPSGIWDQAMAVQGHYTGLISKSLAFFMDLLFVTISFGVLMLVVELSWMFLMKSHQKPSLTDVSLAHFSFGSDLMVGILYCLYWLFYFGFSTWLVGMTLGMNIVGLKVVADRRRSRSTAMVHSDENDGISFVQALVRSLLLPLTGIFLPLLGFVGFLRRDGRMLQDLVAGTGIIYKWDAHMADFRFQAEQSRRQVMEQAERDHYEDTALLDESHHGSTPMLRTESGSDEDEHTASYSTFTGSPEPAKGRSW
jgi:uncharacterized RDD family membrane protein YckC